MNQRTNHSYDCVPTGFKGYGMKTRVAKAHEFGLRLPAEDKRSLIALFEQAPSERTYGSASHEKKQL